MTDCDNYLVTGSTHSIPCLVGDAKDFLDEVGERFASKLKEMGEDEYKFRVNSLLRTLADQRNLKKVNPNAAKTVLCPTSMDVHLIFQRVNITKRTAKSLATQPN